MLTGEQYLSSLDDERVTYFEGRRIKDLLSEPAFEVPARAIAAGYDRCYSAEPGATNPLVVAPRSPEELRERAGVITEMDLALNVTYQSLMTLLTAAPKLHGVDPVYQDRLKAYVDDAFAATSASPSASPTPRATARCRPPSRTIPTPTSTSSSDVRRRRHPGRQAAHQRGLAVPRPDGDADQVDEAGRGGLRHHLRGARRTRRACASSTPRSTPRATTSATTR